MADIFLLGQDLPITVSLHFGEMILWQGQSDSKLYAQTARKQATGVLIFLSLLILVILWIYRDTWRIISLFVVLLGGIYFLMRADRSSSTYVLTNHRVMSYDQRGFQNEEIALRQVIGVRVAANASGIGSVSFIPADFGVKHVIVFASIQEASKVDQLAKDAQRAILQNKKY